MEKQGDNFIYRIARRNQLETWTTLMTWQPVKPARWRWAATGEDSVSNARNITLIHFNGTDTIEQALREADFITRFAEAFNNLECLCYEYRPLSVSNN